MVGMSLHRSKRGRVMDKGNKKLQSSQHNSLQWHLKEVEVQQSAQRITTLHVITFRVQPFAKVVQGFQTG